MAKKIEKNIITGIDIGTSKIFAVIAEVTADGEIEIIGTGCHLSPGLRRGVVVDIEATVNSIQRAVQEAELMAGCEVRTVYACIAGSHIRSLNSHGIVAIRDREVSLADVERVIDAAKAVAIPADQKILHVLPQEFIIDHQGSIREPIGMAGVRLESRVHIVTGSVSAAQNIVKCVRRCGLEVNDIILGQLASSHSVLTEDEKDLGVCLIDIGGGTTDIAVFYQGAIQHTAVIPIAGDQVTNDIAMALRTPTKAAESIKLNHACALTEMADSNLMLEVASVNDRIGRKISAKALSDVVAARYEELFTLVRHELHRSGFADRMAAGMVLTGGAANVRGGVELAEQCFEMPVRKGCAHPVNGMAEASENPSFATGIGLLLHGYKQEYETNYNVPAVTNKAQNMWACMKVWFPGYFLRGNRVMSELNNAVIKVVGVGGGGGNALEHMVSENIDGVKFICANTDEQALRGSHAGIQIQLGEVLTKGLGAGADPKIGREAAEEDRDNIKEILSGADMVFITAGMGGGTGTGAAPVFAEVAKELGILTVAIVTKPFSFEGKQRALAAEEGIRQLAEHVDSLITIPNNKLLSVLGKNISLLNAFKAANNVLLGAVKGISDLITRPGLINVDFADVRTVMSEMGMAMMGTGSATGEQRARQAAEAAIASPLLEDANFSGARGILVNITAGINMSIGEFEEVGDVIKEFISDDATVVVGTVIDPEMTDEMRVTVIVTGLGDMRQRHQQAQPQYTHRARMIETTRSDGSLDYQQLDRPAVVRKQAQLKVPLTAKKNSDSIPDVDYLDIPAFLRRQEEVTE